MVSALQAKLMRNPAVECGRLAAAVAVVVLHVGFPGTLGRITNCLTRFAVPFFLGISGYYHYGADTEKIRSRLKGIWKLNLWSLLIYVLWSGLLCLSDGGLRQLRGILPTGKEILQWLCFHEVPYGEHLWYLTAMVTCYLVFWGYTRLFRGRRVNYLPLYAASGLLFGVYCILGIVLDLIGQDLPAPCYRNGWLLGLPMFIMGIFLREHQQKLKETLHLTIPVQLALISAGIAVSMVQNWKIGTTEIPAGMFLTVPVLILLLAGHPDWIPADGWFARKLVPHFGSWSTAIYVNHVLFYQMYCRFLMIPLAEVFGIGEEWLRPLIILAVSVLAAMIWDGLRIKWARK